MMPAVEAGELIAADDAEKMMTGVLALEEMQGVVSNGNGGQVELVVDDTEVLASGGRQRAQE
jgi:hypothetical protein